MGHGGGHPGVTGDPSALSPDRLSLYPVWGTGMRADQSLKKTEYVVYGMPWESGIMAHQSLKKDSL